MVDSGESVIDSRKVWNLTNEVHLTLTEWNPIPRIYPIRATVGRQVLTSGELEN